MHLSARVLVLVLALVTALTAGGCGEDSSSSKNEKARTAPDRETSTVDDAPPSGKRAQVPAELEITISKVGSKDPNAPGIDFPPNMACTKSIPATCHAELTCTANDAQDEPGGAAESQPPSRELWQLTGCTYLTDHLDELFAGVDLQQMCTEQYGGPEVGRITGTVAGRKVDYEFTRTNGCHIADWERHEPLWNAPAAPSPAVPCPSPKDAPPDSPVSSDCAPIGADSGVVDPGSSDPGAIMPPVDERCVQSKPCPVEPVEPEAHGDPADIFR